MERELSWEIDTAIVDPILKVDGNYILIAEKKAEIKFVCTLTINFNMT